MDIVTITMMVCIFIGMVYYLIDRKKKKKPKN